jgi:hypothetical protein
MLVQANQTGRALISNRLADCATQELGGAVAASFAEVSRRCHLLAPHLCCTLAISTRAASQWHRREMVRSSARSRRQSAPGQHEEFDGGLPIIIVFLARTLTFDLKRCKGEDRLAVIDCMVASLSIETNRRCKHEVRRLHEQNHPSCKRTRGPVIESSCGFDSS